MSLPLVKKFASTPLDMPVREVAEMMVASANDGQVPFVELVHSLATVGLDSSRMKAVHKWTRHIEVVTKFSFVSDEKRPTFTSMSPLTRIARTEVAGIAYIRVAMERYDGHIHQCQLEDCDTYFVGDPRSKWCSDGCGAKYRVRKKRQKDRL